MPLLLFGAGAALLPLLGVAVENWTSKTTTQPTQGTVHSASLPDVIKWPLIIGGSIVAIKYGTKLIKKL
jgi:hypothetical protein